STSISTPTGAGCSSSCPRASATWPRPPATRSSASRCAAGSARSASRRSCCRGCSTPSRRPFAGPREGSFSSETEGGVFGSILHRMILWELVKVFTIALVGITGILLMAGLIAEASQQGLGPGQVLAAIPLLIPSTLPYTIPATTLFATCVVYGRLAADNE